jgi:hypothetical protein
MNIYVQWLKICFVPLKKNYNFGTPVAGRADAR